MTTLKLPEPLEADRPPKRRPVYKSSLRPYLYVPRYQRGGALLLCKDPPPVVRVILSRESLRRHNSLQPALQPTHRMLLRWGESGGNGLPNPEADVRELHYDPLPPDLQERVDGIVAGSPWEMLTRKWYRTDLTTKALADELCVSRKQLYVDWGNSLWYFRGRFETEAVHE